MNVSRMFSVLSSGIGFIKVKKNSSRFCLTLKNTFFEIKQDILYIYTIVFYKNQNTIPELRIL